MERNNIAKVYFLFLLHVQWGSAHCFDSRNWILECFILTCAFMDTKQYKRNMRKSSWAFLFGVSVCVCVAVCVFVVCLLICVYVCMCVWRLEIDVSCLSLIAFYHYFLIHGLSLNPKLINLAMLFGQ